MIAINCFVHLIGQFAMGLNMPAKTVVFTALRKFDGDSHRWMASGEYIQVIIMIMLKYFQGLQ
jgi:hypothetical protein